MSLPIAILVSGAPGTGKTTLRRHAPYALSPHLGETAALGVDEFYCHFDPLWTTNNRDWWALAMANCLMMAGALFAAGVRCVVIEGNGFYTRESVNLALERLLPLSRVYHVTLDADHAVVTERIRARSDLAQHPPEWIAEWLAHIRGHYAPWTHVIDTSSLTTDQVLDCIVALVQNDDRRLSERLG